MELEHIDADIELPLALVGLELVGIQLHVDEDDMGIIEGHDPQTGLVELQVNVDKDLLEGVDEQLERRSLDGLYLEDVIGAH